MRVNDQTKFNMVQKNLNANAEELQDLMVGLSNGKKLNKPSDDPVGAAKVQDFRTSINRSKNLEKNLSSDKVWLNSTEGAVSQISETMMKIKESALKGATDGVTKEERMAISKEVEMITGELVKLTNKREGKLFVFAGTKTFSEPLTMNDRRQPGELHFDGLRAKSEVAFAPINQSKPLNDFLPAATDVENPDLPPLPPIRPGILEIMAEPKPVYDADGNLVAPTENIDEAPVAAEVKLDADGNPIPAEGEPQVDADGNPIEPQLDADGNPIDSAGPPEPPVPFGPRPVRVAVTGQESVIELVKKINDGFIEAGNYKEDPNSPLGYETKLFAQIGADNKIYLDPAADHTLKFGPDETGLMKAVGFKFLGQAPGTPAIGTAGDQEGATHVESSVPYEEFEPVFDGYSKKPYLVRVAEPGTYGNARYVVSDDEGRTWSPKQILNKTNEIFNPEGSASDQVRLKFNVPGKPYFMEGLEFQFNGNEFVEYHGNDEIKKVPLDNGIKVALNTTAKELLWAKEGDPETVNSFEVLNRLIEALEEDDQDTVSKSIAEIDTAMNQVLKIRAEIGTRGLELESSQERLAQNIDYKGAEMSDIEDMDLAKGSIDLNKAELKHKSALEASSRLIQPSLVQFLK